MSWFKRSTALLTSTTGGGGGGDETGRFWPLGATALPLGDPALAAGRPRESGVGVRVNAAVIAARSPTMLSPEISEPYVDGAARSRAAPFHTSAHARGFRPALMISLT